MLTPLATTDAILKNYFKNGTIQHITSVMPLDIFCMKYLGISKLPAKQNIYQLIDLEQKINAKMMEQNEKKYNKKPHD